MTALEAILEGDLFEFESETSVRAALRRMRQGKADFADYLLGELNAANGCRTTATFDRALSGEASFLRL